MNNDTALMPYTVTIAGHERYDGEKPWTYVIDAENELNAIAIAAAYMGRNTGWVDLVVISVIPGTPPANCGYHWNDLRKEPSNGD